MPRDSSHSSRLSRSSVGSLAVVGLLVCLAISDAVRAAPLAEDGAAPTTVDHLVVSEVVTGGSSASDEFVELYNPSGAPLNLDGLELVYVTASGATITRKAAWGPETTIGPGGHLLIANEAGIFAVIADATYASGLAAAGGSMALRIVAAPTAIDAVGWGTAASTWIETLPAPAPPASSSLERLPGGSLGSGQDTDHNLVDFTVRSLPDPQNSGSPPVPDPSSSPDPTTSPEPTITEAPSASAAPSASPTPPEETESPLPTPEPTPAPSATVSPTAEPTAEPTPEPTATPSPSPMTIAAARQLPDGASVIVRGVALTGSDFHDGGGYVADATGGIAVLVDGASFARGADLLVSGVLDDRYAQRTIRTDAGGVTIVGVGFEPAPLDLDTGGIGEAQEGQLVGLSGTVQGSPVQLTAGLAYQIDDGSGPIRILVGLTTGIDSTTWQDGVRLTVVGVVGQRDSSGTGLEGYRVQPRDGGDVGSVEPPVTPEPTASPTASPTPTTSANPTPSASPQPALVSIADARGAESGTRLRIRGVVTLPTGLIDAGSAVVADPSGAILVRTATEVRPLRRGEYVELNGTRSTKSGMLSLRVSQPAVVLGSQAEPAALQRATGAIGEPEEGLLLTVRGLVDGQRRSSGGLSFTVNDGSGPLRVYLASETGVTAASVPSGSWVELRGVLGQETTGAQPFAGYRLWPRDRDDTRVLATAVPAGGAEATTIRSPSALTKRSAPPSDPGLPVPPDLGASALRSATSLTDVTANPGPLPPAPLPVPLAAGLGGLAGLLALAWRHGTIGRLRDEAQGRLAMVRAPRGGEEESESYTPAP